MRGLDALAGNISSRSRVRKFEHFMYEMAPNPGTRVLDVGVDNGGPLLHGEHDRSTNFFEAMYPWPERITALGTHRGEIFQAAFPQVRYVQGNGIGLPFPDKSFDVVFSNAVIEHVGPHWHQHVFAKELARVARRLFVTTPNRGFFIETHTHLPFVHWLPQAFQWPIYRACGHEWANEATLNLLSRSDLQAHFPDARVSGGMTLVAVRS